MKNYTLKIGLLSISALVLFIAQFVPVRTAEASAIWKDRDYTMITATSSRGGDTIYVVDNRTGQMAVLVWDASARGFKLAAVEPIADAFAR